MKIMKITYTLNNMEDLNKKYKLSTMGFSNMTLPSGKEVITNKDWVLWGKNNLYSNTIIDYYQNNALHKAIIDSKVNQVCGEGLVSKNEPMAVVNLVNGKETIDDVFRKVALDFELFNGFALEVIWKRDRSEGIAEIHHIDYSRIRSGKINEDTDEVDEYFYSTDWTNVKKFVPEAISAFSMDNKDPRQIMYFKNYVPNQDYYPLVRYSGALMALEISIAVHNFHRNNLKNGLNPSLWIDLVNGVPDEEEQDMIVSALEQQYSGTDNAGKAVISFSESPELSPKITPIASNGTDGYYTALYQDLMTNILSGHRISSGELFGISTTGSLGSGKEIEEHSEYIRNTVIKPDIQTIVPVLNKLMSLKMQKPIRFTVKPLSIVDTTIEEIKEEPKTEA